MSFDHFDRHFNRESYNKYMKVIREKAPNFTVGKKVRTSDEYEKKLVTMKPFSGVICEKPDSDGVCKVKTDNKEKYINIYWLIVCIT